MTAIGSTSVAGPFPDGSSPASPTDGTLLRRDPAGGRRQQAGRRPPRRRRRWATLAVVAVLSGGTATALLPRLTGSPDPVVCAADPVQAQALDGLADFASWLRANRVPGYIGEVGWPSGADQQQWAAVADVWYRGADRIGLPVTAWAAARWPADYRMGVYRAGSGSTSLDTVGPQAEVLEAHGSTRRVLRGVVVASGSFGTSSGSPGYSAAAPGRYGHDYTYENRAGYQFLAARGVHLVRMAVAWERLQPRPGGPLQAAEVGRLRRAVVQAEAAGLSVILDLHGYGDFTVRADPADGTRTVLSLGSAALPTAALADFWSRMARATADLPGVLGYDLLNEPARLAARGDAGTRLWERASQEAVDAVRATGSRKPVFVSAYGRTTTLGWSRDHPRPWVHDPLARVVYQAHVYFDADGSGRYADGYSGAVTGAAREDLPRCRRLPDLSDQHTRVLGGGPWWRSPARMLAATGLAAPEPTPARTQALTQVARMQSLRSSSPRVGARATDEGRQ